MSFLDKFFTKQNEAQESICVEGSDTDSKLCKMKTSFEISEIQREIIIEQLLQNNLKYFRKKYGGDYQLKQSKIDMYKKGYIFSPVKNVYGVARNKSGNTEEYWKVDGKEVKFLFNPDKYIPPFSWLEEEYEKHYKEGSPDFQKMKKVFIESDRRGYIAEHNDRLQRAGYSYLIDDKGVYRLFKVSAEGKKEGKGVSGIRYETLWRDDDIKHTKNKIVDGYKKVSITEYGQEIPKESEEYYEIMQKIRGKTESEQ